MEYDFDDIDDYLNGRMSESDRAKFEAAMQANPALADDVEAQRAAEGVLFAMRVETLKEKMAQWDNEPTSREDTPEPIGSSPESSNSAYASLSWRRATALLATLSLVGLGIWKWPFGQQNQREKAHDTQRRDTILNIPPPIIPPPVVPPSPIIAAQWPNLYRDIDTSSNLMGNGEGGDSLDYLLQAEKLYLHDDFKGALLLLAVPDSSQMDKYLWLRAHSYYKLNMYNLAEQDFRSAQQYNRLRADAERGELACLIQQMPQSRARLEKRLKDGLGKRLGDLEMTKLKESLKGRK